VADFSAALFDSGAAEAGTKVVAAAKPTAAVNMVKDLRIGSLPHSGDAFTCPPHAEITHGTMGAFRKRITEAGTNR
jgi:hypothetical protein